MIVRRLTSRTMKIAVALLMKITRRKIIIMMKTMKMMMLMTVIK